MRSPLFTQIFNQRYLNHWNFNVIDKLLFTFLLLLCMIGILTLYSASNHSWHAITFQSLHYLIGLSVMLICANIQPLFWKRLAPWLYGFSIMILAIVFIVGHIGKGAQRWLHIGIFNFQPSEFIKITLPLCIAWYYHHQSVPSPISALGMAILIILIPAILTAKQPDLGSALLLTLSGISLLLLVMPLNWKYCIILLFSLILCMPYAWHYLHDYQRQRLFTFIHPERDPLGAGYHIIQSKIALGSGGLTGKGWLNGTQSHLHFLPEHTTDFIFAVIGEEFGFIGTVCVITLYAAILARSLHIMLKASTTFTRLLAAGIAFTFFISFFINISMVTGILPVVGVPLPLISYGGSSIVVTLANFGILMSIQARPAPDHAREIYL